MSRRVIEVDGVALVSFCLGSQEKPTAERTVALADLGLVVPAVLEHLHGHWLTSDDDGLLDALLAAGATMVRHSHIYGLRLDGSRPIGRRRTTDRWRVSPLDSSGVDLTPLSRRAYPAGHVDHDDVDPSETAQVLQGLLDGALVGDHLGHAGAVAVVEDPGTGAETVVGVCIVNRAPGTPPEGGPWVTEIFRDPAPRFAGVGRDLLRHAIDELAAAGESTLGLAVTEGNPARRLYEAMGFERVLARRKIGIPTWPAVDPV